MIDPSILAKASRTLRDKVSSLMRAEDGHYSDLSTTLWALVVVALWSGSWKLGAACLALQITRMALSTTPAAPASVGKQLKPVSWLFLLATKLTARLANVSELEARLRVTKFASKPQVAWTLVAIDLIITTLVINVASL